MSTTPSTINSEQDLNTQPAYTIVVDKDEVALRRMPWGWVTWHSSVAIEPVDIIAEGAPLRVVFRPKSAGVSL